jgi:lysophospholipid acyltransferase (LPLAT)-like uncharacterized protein
MNVRPNARRSGVVVPHRAALHQRLAARTIAGIIQAVAATMRFNFHDETGAFGGADKPRIIIAVWHNRLALSMVIYQRYLRQADRSGRLAAMVSASRDGGVLASFLELFDVQPVRGSTSRRGPQALRELTTWAERGFHLAITPDGPRGPRYAVQEGIISLAQLTGLPIAPVSMNLSRKLQLHSWDRFQVPLPFSRCDVRVGPVLHVPPDADENIRATLRGELERVLQGITRD